ncbi:hypothetical protein [Kribbella sp. NPDC048928]
MDNEISSPPPRRPPGSPSSSAAGLLLIAYGVAFAVLGTMRAVRRDVT